MLKTAHDLGSARAYEDVLGVIASLEGFDKEAGRVADLRRILNRWASTKSEALATPVGTLARDAVSRGSDAAGRGAHAVGTKGKELFMEGAEAAGRGLRQGGEKVKNVVVEQGGNAADALVDAAAKSTRVQQALRGGGVGLGALGGYSAGESASDSPVGGILGALVGAGAGYGGLRGLHRLARSLPEAQKALTYGGGLPVGAALAAAGLVGGAATGTAYDDLLSGDDERRHSRRG